MGVRSVHELVMFADVDGMFLVSSMSLKIWFGTKLIDLTVGLLSMSLVYQESLGWIWQRFGSSAKNSAWPVGKRKTSSKPSPHFRSCRCARLLMTLFATHLKCACLHYASARLFCTPHALSGVVLLRVCIVVRLTMRPGGALTTHGMSQTIETSVEQSLDDTARALKIYIHNQIAQATLVLSGNSIGEGAPAAAPPPGGNGGLPDVRTTPTLRGSNVDLGL